MAKTAKQGEALADMRAKLNAKQAETPPDAEPTEKQAAAVKRLEASVASLQKRYDQGNATLETYIATLEKMGVAADLSDQMGTRLLREREKTTQAAIAAQEKLNAKIAAAPEEGERTKAQEYSIRRLVTALEAAQSRAQQAQVALQNYEGIKLNEAIVTQQVRLREELTAVEPVIARANVETLALTENRRKAAEAATAQAEAEKLLATQAKAAAEAEDKYNAEFAARQRTQRQAETGRFAKGGEIEVSSAAAAAANQLSLRAVRQSAVEEAVRDYELQQTAVRENDRVNAESANRALAIIKTKTEEVKSATAQQASAFEELRREAEKTDAALFKMFGKFGEHAQQTSNAAAKAAAEAEDKYNAEFAARQRAETGRFAKGGEVDVSSAAAAAANQLSLRAVRQSAVEEAVRDYELQQAATRENDRINMESANRALALIKAKTAEVKSAATEQASAFEELRREAERTDAALFKMFGKFSEHAQQTIAAAAKAAIKEEEDQEREFAERQRALNTARIAEDQRLLEEEKRINQQKANFREFDFQEAVAAQTREAALEKQRAAAAQEQQKRLEQLLESQEKITRAQAAIPTTLLSGAVPQAPRDFSQSITAILAPAQAARETLGGIEKQVDAIAVAMLGAKQRSEDYDKILRDLGATFGALQRQANLVETFRQQEQATEKLSAELTREVRALEAMNVLYERTKVYDEAQVRTILDQTNKVKGLTTAFNSQNETFSQTRAAAQAAGIDINNLAASEARITDAALRGSSVLKAANAASGRGNEFSFLGLRPYELQNLSYQINDVFTQLASGTSITQTLSQQGGQIFQLFQRQIVGVVASLKEMPLVLTAVGVAAVTATVGILTFIRAIDVLAEKRKIAASLAQDVDGARYSVDKLIEGSKGLERLGVGLTEAAAGAKELSEAGFAPEKILPLQRLAASMSSANGTKFAENIKQLREAFMGTGQDLVKWATEVNHLLDVNQFTKVQEAVEKGDLLTARAIVFEIANKRMAEAAEKNTSQVVKAFREFKQAWFDLLDSLAANRVVNWFGTRIINDLTVGLNLMRALLDAARALSELNFKNLHEALSRDLAPGTTGPGGVGAASVPGQKPGETPDFVALRDRVADAVGISREAFRLLQQSEGKWDARANKWSDALDKAGNVIENGGKGAAQVVTSTFDEMKKKYPDLIKGDIHDVASNLMAGALYLREMAERGNNVFGKAVEAYKQGPGVAFGGAQMPVNAATLANQVSARALAAQFSGPVITRPGAPQTLEATPQVTSTATPEVTELQRQGVATEKFRKAQQDIIDSQQKAFADEDKLYEIFTRDLQRAAEKVREQAAAAAKESGAEQLDQHEVNAKVEAAQEDVRKQYHQAWLQRQEEQANKYREIAQRALSSDKTNFDARMRLLELQQAAERAELEKQQGRGLFKNAPPGQTIEDVRNLQAQTQAKERTDLAVDVAKATVASITEQRDKQLAEIRARAQIAPPAEQAALFAEQNRLFLSFLPKINEAVKLANGILAKLPPSEAVREAQARNALVLQQARRPEAIGAGEAAAVSAIAAPLQAGIETNRSRLENIVESVKVSGVSASAALESIFTFSKKSVADLKAISDSTNAGLRSVMAQEGVTPAEKSKLQAQIEANVNAPGKAAVDAQNAVMAVLAEEKAKLDKLLAEYKQAVTDLENKIRDSRLSPVQAATERAKLDQKFIPEIAQRGRAYGEVLTQGQTGAAAANFSPAFRAELAAEQQRAATLSNEQTNRSVSARKAAQDNLTIGKTALATMNESIRTQQELLKAGATTQTEAENATREAHEEATKAVANLEPEIQKNIAALNEMGDNQGAKKLAADFKLLQVQVAYVDPLVQQITTGLEQSFTGRGLAAIETIAQSFGKLITGQEKFKDLLGDVGSAFATFTAGVLQDVAKIIIQYELLKVIKDALGVGPGATAGGGGWLASLFSSGAGAAAGAAAPVDASAFASITSGIAHSGAIVGDSGMSRVVDLSVFRDAQRFHNGGMVLRRDEIPIIAQRGEKIVSLAQQRTEAAQKVAQKSQEGTSIRNVLAVGDKEVASAMNSSHGEKVVLNIMQRNAPTVKKWVG
jgi:hypothetical protein